MATIDSLKSIETWSKSSVMAVCLVIVAVVGMMDYLTGYETFFFIFYLAAVFLGVWYVSVSFGIMISALSVTAWISTNLAAGAFYANLFVPIWNAVIMFLFYLVVVGLLAKLRALQKELEERVRQRTSALTQEIMERLRLQKEILETSEREQRRIGHDLHDSLCQHLTGTALAGHVLGQKLADKSLPETGEANRLVELVEDAIELTRTLARGLHPVTLEAGGLEDGFQELAAMVRERFKISCDFEYARPLCLRDVNIATHLYRIAQEAITNAIKHGKATHICIEIEIDDDNITLTVTDNGIGLPESTRNRHGLGLRIMAYRADMIGATFEIARRPGGGTCATCILPAARSENYVTKN